MVWTINWWPHCKITGPLPPGSAPGAFLSQQIDPPVFCPCLWPTLSTRLCYYKQPAAQHDHNGQLPGGCCCTYSYTYARWSFSFSASWRTPEKLICADSAASLSQPGMERVFFTGLYRFSYSSIWWSRVNSKLKICNQKTRNFFMPREISGFFFGWISSENYVIRQFYSKRCMILCRAKRALF